MLLQCQLKLTMAKLEPKWCPCHLGRCTAIYKQLTIDITSLEEVKRVVMEINSSSHLTVIIIFIQGCVVNNVAVSVKLQEKQKNKKNKSKTVLQIIYYH